MSHYNCDPIKDCQVAQRVRFFEAYIDSLAKFFLALNSLDKAQIEEAVKRSNNINEYIGKLRMVHGVVDSHETIRKYLKCDKFPRRKDPLEFFSSIEDPLCAEVYRINVTIQNFFYLGSLILETIKAGAPDRLYKLQLALQKPLLDISEIAQAGTEEDRSFYKDLYESMYNNDHNNGEPNA